MRERESLRMKNFIFKSSSESDLLKILQKLDIIQKEQRHARYDLQVLLKRIDTCVKGLAILVSAPENDSETLEEEIGTTEDIRDGS